MLEVLKEKRAIKGQVIERVVFNAMTKAAVHRSHRQPARDRQELVDAYLARRALDYLVGFTLSPVLWRKLPGARSAGRVQSVALRLVCEREIEIEIFRPREYWTMDGDVRDSGAAAFLQGSHSGRHDELDKFTLDNEAGAKRAVAAIGSAGFAVGSVESKPVKRNPHAAVHHLDAAAGGGRKLGFAAAHTMRVAQQLYEGVDIGGETVGLITYMRTDGVQMAGEAIRPSAHDDRRALRQELCARQPARIYQQGQERAGSARGDPPDRPRRARPQSVARHLDADQARLYELIWKRAMASQMESAELERTTVDIEAPAANAAGTARHRHGDQVRRIPHALPGRPRRRPGRRGRRQRLPAMSGRRAAEPRRRSPRRSISPSRRRAIRRPLWSSAWRSSASAGRPPMPRSCRCCRTAAMCASRGSGCMPEDRGRSCPRSWRAFSPATSNMISPPISRSSSTTSPTTSSNGSDLLRDFWTDFTAAVDEIKDLRIGQVIEALDEMLAPHIFPPRADGTDPRLCPPAAPGGCR